MRKSTVFIYHSNCSDGVGSVLAYLITHFDNVDLSNLGYEDIIEKTIDDEDKKIYHIKELDTTFIPANYSHTHENFERILNSTLEISNSNKIDVISADFASKDLIQALNKDNLKNVVDKILILDHHATSASILFNEEQLEEVEKNEVYSNKIKLKNGLIAELVFSFKKSGSLLTYEYFKRKGKIKFNKSDLRKFEKIIEYISDRDLWKFELPHSKEVSNAIYFNIFGESNEIFALIEFIQQVIENFDNEDELLYFLKEQGHVIEKVKNVEIWRQKNNIHKITIKTIDDSYITFPALNISSFISEAGNYFVEENGYDVIVLYQIIGDKVKLSFRSNKGLAKPYAERFNGGGHPNAAGAIVDIKDVEFLK